MINQDTSDLGWARRLAWVLWALIVVLQLPILLLAFLARAYGNGPDDIPLFDRFLLFLPNTLTFATVGALVATRQPRNPVGWLFIGSQLVGITGEFAEAYWRYALLVRPGTLPGGTLALWLNTRPYFVMRIFELLLILLFPTGRPLSPRWWLAGCLVILGVLIQVTAQALIPGQLDPSLPIANPFGLAGRTALLERISTIGGILTMAGALATALALILRLRRARGVERQQVKLLAASLVVYVAGIVAVAATAPQVPGVSPSPAANLAFVFQALSGVLVAVAAGIAILRHHLFDIDLIIRRTLIYALVTATLGAIYLVAVVALQALFVRLTGQESTLAVVASTLAIAVLFQPLRRRVQAIIDRRFDRTRYDARLVLEQFAARAQREADLDTLSADLLATVDEALKPSEVRLWLARSQEVRR
jgi:hypothetical protein